jgi:hypothetical protein
MTPFINGVRKEQGTPVTYSNPIEWIKSSRPTALVVCSGYISAPINALLNIAHDP